MAEFERYNVTHLDGTRIFQNEVARQKEAEVAKQLEEVWKCKITHFGLLSPIDWFAERYGRVVGLLELKWRPHPHDQYPTVFLNVRKWLALQLGSVGMGCPALFVARFTDGVYWINVGMVDGSKHRITGWKAPQGATDIEPLIEVDITAMALLKAA